MRTILPKPLQTEDRKDFLHFKRQLFLHIGQNFKNELFVKNFPSIFKNFTAGMGKLIIVRHKEDAQTAVLSINKCEALPKGATEYDYELDITNERGVLTFTSDNGLIHAMATTLQLIEPYSSEDDDFKIDCVKVLDKPALKMRGVHLDYLHGADWNLYKKTVMFAGFMKCTHVLLESVGMIEIKSHKELSWPDAIKQKEIKKLVELGKTWGLEFIPIYPMFGHAAGATFRSGKHAVIDRNPKFAELFEEFGWEWNHKNPKTRELLRDVENELIELFGEGEYFHLTCDEVSGQDRRRDGMDPEDNQYFVDTLNYMARDVVSKGRKPIMWGDMFLDPFGAFDYPFCRNCSIRFTRYEENLSKLDPNMIIDDWQYDIDVTRPESVEFFLKYRKPEQIVLSPWKGWANVKGRAHLAKQYGLLGMIATTWNNLEATFPRCVTLACCNMWSEDEDYVDLLTTETLKLFSARYLEKMIPSRGKFAESGFFRDEFRPDYERND